jgi:IS30 family transposase
VQFGRKPKLSAHQRTEALKRLDAGESCRSIAKTTGVHHQTISKLAG